MKHLILVRHGETIWNAEQRLQGQTDIPLSDVGRRQAHQLAARLAGETIDAVVSSDLQRAMDTAVIIAEPHRLTVRADPRLRQSHRGKWEGLTYAEIERLYPGSFHDTTPPEGESLESVHARVRSWLDDVRRDHADQTVLAVSHGHILRVVIALALEIDPVEAWRFETGNAALTEIRFDDAGAVLHRLNDGCHLDRAIHRAPDE
jgi:broad specificity phosphatase PhoE